MTNSDGLFSFLAIGSGSYRLEIVSPTDMGPTTRDAGGDEETDSDFDRVTSTSA